jgi:hypothetical protein
MPGQNGNPNGRPHTKDLLTALRNTVAETGADGRTIEASSWKCWSTRLCAASIAGRQSKRFSTAWRVVPRRANDVTADFAVRHFAVRDRRGHLTRAVGKEQQESAGLSHRWQFQLTAAARDCRATQSGPILHFPKPGRGPPKVAWSFSRGATAAGLAVTIALWVLRRVLRRRLQSGQRQRDRDQHAWLGREHRRRI